MAYVSTLDRYTPAKIPGITYNTAKVEHHGTGIDRDFVYPGRLAVNGTWPESRPETCNNEYPTKWLADGQILVCLGCGLDCT